MTSENFVKYLVTFSPGRVKAVPVPVDTKDNFLLEIEGAVREALSHDRFLSHRAEDDFLLTYQSSTSKKRVEIDGNTFDWEVHTDNSDIRIEFVDCGRDQENRSCLGDVTNRGTSLNVSANEISFLDKVGIPFQSVPASCVVKATASQNREISVTDKRKQGEKRKETENSDSDGEYWEDILIKRREKDCYLQSLGIVPKTVPKLPKKKRVKKTNESNKENVRRVMPARAAKFNKQLLPQKDLDEELEQLAATEQLENVSVSVPLSSVCSSGKEERSDSVRSKQIIIPKSKNAYLHKMELREPGKIINKFVPLPQFPKKLEDALLIEKKFDRPLVNSFLFGFVKKFTGQTYILKNEYKILAKKAVLRMRSLHISNAFSFLATIKKGLSNTSRAERWYVSRGKQQRRKKRKSLLVRIDNPDYVSEQLNSSMEDIETIEEDLDAYLKLPVVDEETTKNALMKSTDRMSILDTKPIRECQELYPYLKDAKLMIYDYYCRVPMGEEEAELNFAAVLEPLAHILHKEKPTNASEEVQLFVDLEEQLCKNIEEVWPSIKFCDVANQKQAALNSVPKEQSPAIIVMLKNMELVSVILVYDAGVLTSLKQPTSFQCISLLMAGYWTFHMEYPKAYKHLEAVEAILHDDLDEYKAKTQFGRILHTAMTSRTTRNT